MDDAYISLYHELEESHWWFRGRRDIIRRLVQGYDRDSAILEVGCSGGPLLELLEAQGFRHAVGIDLVERSVDLCRSRGRKDVAVADGCRTGFRDNQFELVIASDVLEHIEKPEIGLNEWSRILAPGGRLLVFVPAFQFLWSSHDKLNCHHRRYTKRELKELLKKSGFIIERATYWNFCFFAPAVALRTAEKILGRHQQETKGGQLKKISFIVNKTLETVIKLENMVLAAGLNFPFGVSVFAMARKP